jgi:predicted nucleic acid-binding protein
MIYLDTSAIVKLYFREDRSKEVATWLEAHNQAIPLTRFHELELINAVQLKFFRGEIVAEEIELFLKRLEDHETRGVYYRPQLDWTEVLETAVDLSKKFAGALASRSLDILHVAAARCMGVARFLSLDTRQIQLAENAGLTIASI